MKKTDKSLGSRIEEERSCSGAPYRQGLMNQFLNFALSFFSILFVKICMGFWPKIQNGITRPFRRFPSNKLAQVTKEDLADKV